MSSPRHGWMDALRGAAILFVIFGHAVQLAAMYSGHDFTRMSALVGVLGPLRMPLLFFLSGTLVPQSLSKGAQRYFRGKLTKILYPYLLWSALLIGAAAIAATSITWWRVPPVWDTVVAPIEHLWFLAYLLVFYAVAYLGRSINALWLVLGATLLMAFVLPGPWGRLPEMAVAFFLGVAFTRYQETIDRVLDNTKLCAALLATVLLLSIGNRFNFVSLPTSLSWSIPILLALFLGTIGVLRPIGDSSALRPLRYVGRQSLIFYLVHWPVMMYLVLNLATEGFRDPWTLFWTSLGAGFVASLLVSMLAARVRLVQWLFEWRPPGKVPAKVPVDA